jgi:aarF domain-containing kinase
MESTLRYIKRFITYAIYGIPVALIGPSAYLLSGIAPGAELWAWDYVVWTIEQLGPAFIKLAQWASTRPDIFPDKLIDKLKRLQDNVDVHYPIEIVEKTLSDAFGADWKDRLELDPNPIGAGCVAQVFKGVLSELNTKTKVAIKLIHPHVEELVKVDMEILTALGKFIDKIPQFEMLSMGEVLKEWANMMNEQLDLRKEAHNLSTFINKFANEKWALFPEPVQGYIKKNVLVETLMEGSPIEQYMKLSDFEESSKKLKLKLSDLGVRAVLKMIFFDNFVHGDLHPGNILVQMQPNGEPKLVFLDCGLVFHAKSEKDHQALVDIGLSFMKHDGRKAASLMVINSKNTIPKNTEDFVEGVQALVNDSESQSYFEHLGDYVTRICNLARDHMVRLDPSYFHIAMVLKIQEGISLALDRELDLVSKCIPIVIKSQAMRKMGRLNFFDSPEEFQKNVDSKSVDTIMQEMGRTQSKTK